MDQDLCIYIYPLGMVAYKSKLLGNNNLAPVKAVSTVPLTAGDYVSKVNMYALNLSTELMFSTSEYV